MEYSIYTIGGFDIFVAVFNQIASLLRSDEGGLFEPMVKMASAIAIFYAVIYVAFGTQIRPLASWFVSHFLIMNILLVPMATVVVKDTMTGQFRPIDHVPFGLAFVASNLSSLGYGITRAMEQVFQPSPRYGGLNPRGIADLDFAAISYTKTGFIFGAHALSQMKNIHIPDDDLADNLHEFVNQCVFYDIANGNKYTRHDLKNSDNIWRLVSERPSKIRGFAWREVPRHHGRIAGTPQTQIITCAQGVEKINRVWAETTQSVLSDVASNLLDFFGFKQKGNGEDALNIHISSHLPGALDKLTGFATSANERIQQQIMISSIIKANELKTVELGGSPNFDVRRAYLQQRNTYQTIGQTISQTLPYLKNVLEALIYCLFIFVLPLSLLPQGWKVIGFWCKICGWIQLWAPLFSILNFIMTEAMASQIMNRVTSSGGFSIANFVGIENAALDMTATAGYLCTLIPLLSWALIERGGYAFVNMASSLLSVSQGAASSAAAEGFTGNYSFGNVAMGGVQANNTSMLKHDSSAAYNSGHFALHDGMSSRVITGDGEQLLQIEQSSLPVTVNSSSYQEQSYRDAYNQAVSTQESESQMATTSKMQASRDFLDFSKQASQHESSNKQWSDNQTASFMKETGSVYNKMKDISQKYGIDEQLVSQGVLSASAGVGTSGIIKNLVGVDISGRGELLRSSSGSVTKAADEIVQLAQSQEFRSAVSHAQEYAKSHNYDLGDQNLKQSVQSFGDHYEKSHQHQQNASAAFEKSQNLSKQIDYVKANSQRIDTIENQKFAEWAADRLGGFDRLEDVSRKNVPLLQQMGSQYLKEHYGGSSHPMPTNEAQMRADYKDSSHKIEKEHPVTPNFERANDLSVQNNVSTNRNIDHTPQVHAIQQSDALVTRVKFDEQRRKTEIRNAQENFKDLEHDHRKGELSTIQQAAAKKMYTSHVRNTN